jgi:hypothetical protein
MPKLAALLDADAEAHGLEIGRLDNTLNLLYTERVREQLTFSSVLSHYSFSSTGGQGNYTATGTMSKETGFKVL